MPKGHHNPIRIFFSTHRKKFYATRSYTEDENGRITMKKNYKLDDVTNDIAGLIVAYQIEFHEESEPSYKVKEREYIERLLNLGQQLLGRSLHQADKRLCQMLQEFVPLLERLLDQRCCR